MKLINKKSIKALFISLSSIFIITGCAIVPNEIDVNESEKLVSFEAVSKDKENLSAKGEKARWGGKIVSVVNKKDVSEIEIVYFPENRYGKPVTGDDSSGRFKAVVEGFIDPVVFESGRLITVVGEVGDITLDIIGEQEYQYPTLKAQGYYMWKEKRPMEAYAFSPFGFRPGFHPGFFYPWYDPFWHSRFSSRFYLHNRFHTGNRNHHRGHRQWGNSSASGGRNQSSNSGSTRSAPRAATRTTRDTKPHQPVVRER
jgi:outer membrane lipoprotein